MRWLSTMIRHGSVFCDAAIFAHAHRALTRGDDKALAAVAELAAAFGAVASERFLETTAQGQAFLRSPTRPGRRRRSTGSPPPGTAPSPIRSRSAAACAGHGIALVPALHAFLHGVASNLISAGVRLIPLGQTDGQRVLGALEEPIAQTAAHAPSPRIDDIGAATLRADIAGDAARDAVYAAVPVMSCDSAVYSVSVSCSAKAGHPVTPVPSVGLMLRLNRSPSVTGLPGQAGR